MTETCLLLSSRRQRILDALAKRDGTRKTKFTDPTVRNGFEVVGRVRETAANRLLPLASPAIQVVLGVRNGWQAAIPAAGRLNAFAGLVMFDEFGLHLHAFADESESGKALEFVKAFGKLLSDWSRVFSDQRLERIGNLLGEVNMAKGLMAKGRYTHLSANIPPRSLEQWFAPFLPKDKP